VRFGVQSELRVTAVSQRINAKNTRRYKKNGREALLSRPRRRDRSSFASCVRLLIDLDHLAELLVLIADELDQFLSRPDPEIDAHGPRLGVRLGIVDREIDL
jgi:hypothetical protein